MQVGPHVEDGFGSLGPCLAFTSTSRFLGIFDYDSLSVLEETALTGFRKTLDINIMGVVISFQHTVRAFKKVGKTSPGLSYVVYTRGCF